MSGFSLPKGFKPVITPKYNPQQSQMLENLLSQLGGGNLKSNISQLQEMASGDPQFYQGMENQAQSFFKNKLLPEIQQNFANSGMLGSSAFQGAQTEAASGLAQTLQNNRMDYQRQSLNDLLSLVQSMITNPTHEYGVYAAPEKEKFNAGSLMNLLSGLLRGFSSK